MDKCKVVYTAHVDNTEDKCSDYLKTDCIVSEESYTYLGVNAGDSLKEIILKLESVLKEQSEKIIKLNRRILKK